jgi:hypothetical protein
LRTEYEWRYSVLSLEIIVSSKPKPGKVAEPAVARKNMDMDVRKLDAARRILGARSDTEAVDRALDYVIRENAELSALDRLYELGGLADVYGNVTTRRATSGTRGRSS